MSVAPTTASQPAAAPRGRFPAVTRLMDLVRQTEIDLRLFGMIIEALRTQSV